MIAARSRVVAADAVVRRGADRGLAAIGIATLGGVLTLSVVPSMFTLDEAHYLETVIALRSGRVTLGDTRGLTPSRELYAFDPAARLRTPATPAAPSVPPLYAPFAVPFTYLGWRGLVLLNTAAFAIAAWLVFTLTDRVAKGRAAPWVATGAFALGGYSLEYAQGLWPQMLSVAICLGSVVVAGRARDAPGPKAGLLAAAAGVFAGVAAGVRYQNVVFAGAVGLGLLLARRAWSARLASLGAYVAGALAPLLGCSAINHARLGSWNPVSKGGSYLVDGAASQAWAVPFYDPLHVLAAKVVDFSLHPPMTGWLPEAGSGAFLVFGAVKKALLQSSPWFAVAFAALLIAWRGLRSGAAGHDPRTTELRAIGIPVGAVIALFATQGFLRLDGIGFNQRYFLEIVPLGAIAFGLALDDHEPRPRAIAVGAIAAAIGAGAVLAMSPESVARQVLLLKAPLALAAASLAVWIAARRAPSLAWGAAGACLAWALAVHVGDDLKASRALRAYNEVRQEELAALVPERFAVFAIDHWKDPYFPLAIDHDLLVVDPSVDAARDAPVLVGELLGKGMRVFVDVSDVSPGLFERIRGGRSSRAVLPASSRLVELLDAPP